MQVEAKLKIKYHVKELEKLRYIDGKSDWIDLRVAENVSMKQGEYRLISMGISVEIPKGYEMLIVPRSSAYKNFGILQTNAMGVVDESFCGDNARYGNSYQRSNRTVPLDASPAGGTFYRGGSSG